MFILTTQTKVGFSPSHIKLVLNSRMWHQIVQINMTFYTELKKKDCLSKCSSKEKMDYFNNSIMQVLVLLKYFYYY